MKIQVLRQIVEEESGAIFDNPTSEMLPPMPTEILDMAEVTEGSRLFGKLISSYASAVEGELTPQSMECILSELEFVHMVSGKIALRLLQKTERIA